MSKRLNVYKDQKPIYDIVMEPSFEKLTEEVINSICLSARSVLLQIPMWLLYIWKM